MLNVFLIVILAASAALAAETPKSAEPKKAPAQTAVKTPATKTPASKAPASVASPQAPKAITIPDGAVEIERGTWRYIDAQGKAWRYRKTPFGLVRFAEEDAMPPEDEPLSDIAAVDKGDTVEFQRRTPFGISKWTRKKTELDANEKLALERAQRSSTAAAKASQE